jgi:hypothetical protein
MAKVGTLCNECCFYNRDKKECGHGLIDMFTQRGATIEWNDDGPAIDRICRYRRTHDWNEDLSLEEKINLSKEEVFLSGSIILLVQDMDNFKDILSKLKDVTKNRFKFIISHECKLSSLLEITKELDIHASFVRSVDEDVSDEKRVFDCLKHMKNGYLFLFNSDKEIDYTVFEKVHKFTSRLMHRVLHIEPIDEKLHQSVSMVHIYKWLNGDMMESFSNKLKNIAGEESSDPQVFNWKEINEACTNNL